MTTFLIVWVFFIFTSTFAHMLIAGLPNPDIAGGILTLIFIMTFALCGVLAGPDDLPRFWVWVYRVNPLTYVIEALLGTTLANAPIVCSREEIVYFAPSNSSTCDEYMSGYMSVAGGYLVGNTGESTNECGYCAMDSTNTFLASLNASFDNRWRDFGFLWAYAAFNIFAAIGFYWLVTKKSRVVAAKA
jgi:ABC-type multidrug transport system permease subunit